MSTPTPTRLRTRSQSRSRAAQPSSTSIPPVPPLPSITHPTPTAIRSRTSSRLTNKSQSQTNSNGNSKRSPFNPLPLSLFPCRFVTGSGSGLHTPGASPSGSGVRGDKVAGKGKGKGNGKGIGKDAVTGLGAGAGEEPKSPKSKHVINLHLSVTRSGNLHGGGDGNGNGNGNGEGSRSGVGFGMGKGKGSSLPSSPLKSRYYGGRGDGSPEQRGGEGGEDGDEVDDMDTATSVPPPNPTSAKGKGKMMGRGGDIHRRLVLLASMSKKTSSTHNASPGENKLGGAVEEEGDLISTSIKTGARARAGDGDGVAEEGEGEGEEKVQEWEKKSPARRLFVGMGMGGSGGSEDLEGSPSTSKSQSKSKLRQNTSSSSSHAQLDLHNNPLLDPSSTTDPLTHPRSSSFESGSSSAQMGAETVITPATPQLASVKARRTLQPSPPIIELSCHDREEAGETITLESDEEEEEEGAQGEKHMHTGKKDKLGSGRKNVRTWAGRESPSASPRLSKKYKAELDKVPFPGVGCGGKTTRPADDEDAGMWEGDETMTQEDYEAMMELAVARGRAGGSASGSGSAGGADGMANADAHAVGFSIWSDEGKVKNAGEGSSSVKGYFDDMDSFMGDAGSEEYLARIRTRSTPATSSTPKYTAENIRNVGRAKVVSTGMGGSGTEEKGNEQENVPPLGWIDLADYEEDKEKARAAIKGKADIGSTSASGEPIKDGLITPSRKRRTSGASLADPPSSGGASLVRGRIGSSASLTTPSTGGGRSGGSGKAMGIRAVPSPSPSKVAEEARRLRSGRDL